MLSDKLTRPLEKKILIVDAWTAPLYSGNTSHSEVETVSVTVQEAHMVETDCVRERICQSVSVMISSLKHAFPSECACVLLARVWMNNLTRALSGHSVTAAS